MRELSHGTAMPSLTALAASPNAPAPRLQHRDAIIEDSQEATDGLGPASPLAEAALTAAHSPEPPPDDALRSALRTQLDDLSRMQAAMAVRLGEPAEDTSRVGSARLSPATAMPVRSLFTDEASMASTARKVEGPATSTPAERPSLGLGRIAQILRPGRESLWDGDSDDDRDGAHAAD